MIGLEQYLYKYTDAQRQLKSLTAGLEEAIRIKDDAYIPPNMAVDPTKARVQKSQLGSPVERAVVMIVDKYWDDIEAVQRQMLHYRTIIQNVDRMILSLEPDQRDYVRYKYFEDRSAETINKLLHVEDTKRKKIRSTALEQMQGYYDTIKSGA